MSFLVFGKNVESLILRAGAPSKLVINHLLLLVLRIL